MKATYWSAVFRARAEGNIVYYSYSAQERAAISLNNAKLSCKALVRNQKRANVICDIFALVAIVTLLPPLAALNTCSLLL
jgi:hypothetical protein